MALQLARDMECDGIIVHESRNRENDMWFGEQNRRLKYPSNTKHSKKKRLL
jgi:hypothetical protein